MAELRADLETLAVRLAETVRSSAEVAAPLELDQAAVGRLSRMDAMQLQQMAKEQQRRSGLRLERVRVALNDYDVDEYGWCLDCGEAVGYARLKARPESTLCIACTQLAERRS